MLQAPVNEIIKYVDVMNFYPYLCKYFNFRVGHPDIHLGDAYKDKKACLRMYDRSAREIISSSPPKQM